MKKQKNKLKFWIYTLLIMSTVCCSLLQADTLNPTTGHQKTEKALKNSTTTINYNDFTEIIIRRHNWEHSGQVIILNGINKTFEINKNHFTISKCVRKGPINVTKIVKILQKYDLNRYNGKIYKAKHINRLNQNYTIRITFNNNKGANTKNITIKYATECKNIPREILNFINEIEQYIK